MSANKTGDSGLDDYMADNVENVTDRFTKSLPEEYQQLEDACVLGQMEKVKELLEDRGLNPDAKLDSKGRTPLIICCCTGRIEMAVWLVDEGKADYDVPDKWGYKPIDIASIHHYCHAGRIDITGELKKRGAQHSWFGAAWSGDYKRLKEYIDNGQDVEERDTKNEFTAVECAIHGGQAKTARYLLTQGAVVPCPQPKRDNPLSKKNMRKEKERKEARARGDMERISAETRGLP